MLPYFPNQISVRAIVTYVVSLAVVSIIFMDYVMNFKFILIGFMFVLMFFVFSQRLTKLWKKISPESFGKKLFWTALSLRIAWVVFSYYFFITETELPFEWEAADSSAYHVEAKWLATCSWSSVMDYLFNRGSISDSGYSFYLTCLYKLFGDKIILARLLKALWSALTCILIYKLASRNFGELTGRMAGIFCMLMPNLIIYCGLHLKETEMLTLVFLFLERTDYLLRTKEFNILNIGLIALVAGSLFFFRTVLGAVAIASFFVGLFFASEKVIKKDRKVLLVLIGVFFVAILYGSTIATEVEEVWNSRTANQQAKRLEQTTRGNQWAKYATGTAMAPIIFTVPFSTMVDVDKQYTQQMLHGGNYVKNFMSIFVIFAFVYLLFINRKWREHTLIGSFTIGYLLVIAYSGFANSERFHIPALPLLLMFAAYGVSQLNRTNYKYVKYWSIVVVIMEFGWAFFKLGSRGIVSF